MGMKLFIEGRPKYTMNIIIIILSIFQGVMLIAINFIEDLNYLEEVSWFFRTGMPTPAVCGPLFLIWALVCILYWTKKVESPKLSTIVAAVLIYFGTINVISYTPFGVNWPNSVHMLQAYVGYGYFIESIISKYKIWKK